MCKLKPCLFLGSWNRAGFFGGIRGPPRVFGSWTPGFQILPGPAGVVSPPEYRAAVFKVVDRVAKRVGGIALAMWCKVTNGPFKGWGPWEKGGNSSNLKIEKLCLGAWNELVFFARIRGQRGFGGWTPKIFLNCRPRRRCLGVISGPQRFSNG